MEQQLVLGRVVHYFNAGSGACQTGLVVGTSAEDPDVANLTVWTHGGTATPREGVSLEASPSTDQSTSTFHFTRDCPWGR